MSSSKPLNSQIYLRQKRTRKRRLKLLFYGFLGVFSIVGALYFVFFGGYFDIRDISVSGISAPISDEIRQTALGAISGRKYLLPRGNILIFPSRQLSDVLEKQFPILDEVTVQKQFPDKIIIKAVEREKIGIVCGESGKTECFYFDSQGVIFSESPEIVGVSVLLLKDDSVAGTSLPLKKYTKETVEFMQEIKKSFLDKAGIGVKYFYFLNQSGDIALRADKDFDIYLAGNDSQQPEEQARILKSILDNEIKDKVSALDYIDLRVDSRAYYKLKE